MTAYGRGSELITWYLARLRKNAQRHAEHRLTPLALVESDKNRIQEIVMEFQSGQKERSAEALRSIQDANRSIRTSESMLQLLTVAGIILFIGLAIFLR